MSARTSTDIHMYAATPKKKSSYPSTQHTHPNPIHILNQNMSVALASSVNQNTRANSIKYTGILAFYMLALFSFLCSVHICIFAAISVKWKKKKHFFFCCCLSSCNTMHEHAQHTVVSMFCYCCRILRFFIGYIILLRILLLLFSFFSWLFHFCFLLYLIISIFRFFFASALTHGQYCV